MNRKTFLRVCGIFGMGSYLYPYAIDKAARSVEDPSRTTPCEEKQEFAQKWVKRLFDNFDGNLDEAKRKEIMEGCGEACFQGSIKGKRISAMDIDTFINAINKSTGEVAAMREGNIVDFRFIGEAKGLKTEDSRCLCPLVESGPEGLSGTYCYCSLGYVREMFRTYTGRDNSVELIESLKRGGKACRFRIILTS